MFNLSNEEHDSDVNCNIIPPDQSYAIVPAAEISNVWIAIDFSGSVHGNVLYWDIVWSVLNQYKDEHPRTFLWSSKITEVPYASMRDYRLHGQGGTEPFHIISQIIAEKFTGHLVLVTDGDIPHDNVTQLRLSLTGVILSKVTAHIVSSDQEPDFSVVEPLTKFPFELRINSTAHSSAVPCYKLEDLDIIDSISTPLELNDKLDYLCSQICLVVRSRPDLLEKINLLHKRLLSSLNVDEITGPIEDLNAQEMQAYQISLNGIYQLRNLFQHSSRYRTYSIVGIRRESIGFSEGSMTRKCSKVVECPILNEIDVPVILLQSDAVVSNFLGYKAFKRLAKKSSSDASGESAINPFNRCPILGGIILSNNAVARKHNKSLCEKNGIEFPEMLLLRTYLDYPDFLADIDRVFRKHLIDSLKAIKYFPLTLKEQPSKRYPVAVALNYIFNHERPESIKLQELINLLSIQEEETN